VDPIYHLHVPKTAGSTINAWLDDLAPYKQVRPRTFEGDLAKFLRTSSSASDNVRNSIVVDASWKLFTVIHGHDNILSRMPNNAKSFVFFRDPVDRSISQHFDHSHLSPQDLLGLRHSGAMLLDCQSLGIEDFLKKWHQSTQFQEIYCDRHCRSLTDHKITKHEFFGMTIEDRFSAARKVIDTEIGFVGLQSAFSESLYNLARFLQVCPPDIRPSINVRSKPIAAPTDLTLKLLGSVTQADHKLLKHVETLVASRKAHSHPYSEKEFEEAYAKDRISDLKLRETALGLTYCMNDTLVGAGFWGRDGAGTLDCCRWTGPGSRSVIYLPNPAWACNIRIAVKGWMSVEVRKSFELWINDRRCDFVFEGGDNVADFICFEAGGEDFLKIEFRVNAAVSDEECGRELSDGRRKGLAIWDIHIER
jgi:hypothetical protein